VSAACEVHCQVVRAVMPRHATRESARVHVAVCPRQKNARASKMARAVLAFLFQKRKLNSNVSRSFFFLFFSYFFNFFFFSFFSLQVRNSQVENLTTAVSRKRKEQSSSNTVDHRF
jgi:hypothetical protein